MKIQLFLFVGLLLYSSSSIAQSLEQSFTAMMAEFKKNPVAYAQAHMTPEVRFTAGHNGEFMDLRKLITPEMKIEDSQYTDLKFFESGELAVVSGVAIIRYANPKGAPATYKDAFTYTFKKQDNDWKIVAMHHTKMEYK